MRVQHVLIPLAWQLHGHGIECTHASRYVNMRGFQWNGGWGLGSGSGFENAAESRSDIG